MTSNQSSGELVLFDFFEDVLKSPLKKNDNICWCIPLGVLQELSNIVSRSGPRTCRTEHILYRSAN